MTSLLRVASFETWDVEGECYDTLNPTSNVVVNGKDVLLCRFKFCDFPIDLFAFAEVEGTTAENIVLRARSHPSSLQISVYHAEEWASTQHKLPH
jgi:hypothetical protein